jgi:hypothetical protein
MTMIQPNWTMAREHLEVIARQRGKGDWIERVDGGEYACDS